jgi:hypothetical protein
VVLAEVVSCYRLRGSMLQFSNECHIFLYICVMFFMVDDSIFKFFSNIVQKPVRVVCWKCFTLEKF